jgi:hypothetical protein
MVGSRQNRPEGMDGPVGDNDRTIDGGLLGPNGLPGPIRDIPSPLQPITLSGSAGKYMKSADSIMANPNPDLESQITDVTCWAAAMVSFLKASYGRTVTQDALIAYAKNQTDPDDNKKKWAYDDGSLNDKFFRNMAEIHAGTALHFRGANGSDIAKNAAGDYEWVRSKIEAFQYILVGEIRSGKYHHCYVLFGINRRMVEGRYEYHWNTMDPGFSYDSQKKKYVANWCEKPHPPSAGDFGFYW